MPPAVVTTLFTILLFGGIIQFLLLTWVITRLRELEGSLIATTKLALVLNEVVQVIGKPRAH